MALTHLEVLLKQILRLFPKERICMDVSKRVRVKEVKLDN